MSDAGEGSPDARPIGTFSVTATATAISGLALFATDLHASLAVLFELRGGLVVAKSVVLLAAGVWPNAALPQYSVQVCTRPWTEEKASLHRWPALDA